ncbi:hypothetical protein IAQ61_011821 [Plenodomus lingam]|uniref:uncharacterized protein n=1 Tax=Leptosphaeria maculans TaxID=5022 RepID=UPI003326BA7B|nr:hypothetical protein IAQ61_011821 [Plenodomus lingam]
MVGFWESIFLSRHPTQQPHMGRSWSFNNRFLRQATRNKCRPIYACRKAGSWPFLATHDTQYAFQATR